jgi:hypothetical protein
MSIIVLPTSQAPDAKPIGLSKELSTDWETAIEVPSYEIPEESFGGGVVTVPGVAEIISPLVVCNKTAGTVTFSARIYRYQTEADFLIANEIPIPAKETIFFPLNGQFIYTGDLLELRSSANTSVDMTISYTIGQAEQDDVV